MCICLHINIHPSDPQIPPNHTTTHKTERVRPPQDVRHRVQRPHREDQPLLVLLRQDASHRPPPVRLPPPVRACIFNVFVCHCGWESQLYCVLCVFVCLSLWVGGPLCVRILGYVRVLDGLDGHGHQPTKHHHHPSVTTITASTSCPTAPPPSSPWAAASSPRPRTLRGAFFPSLLVYVVVCAGFLYSCVWGEEGGAG
jgi:hypothetical protein